MSATVLRKLQQARQRLQDGEIDAAVALLQDVVRRAPRHPEALWLLGTARLMANQPHQAIALLERAAQVEPEHGAVLENLGLAYLMQGDNARAEAALRKAAAISGAPASVSMRLGIAVLNQGRVEEAIAELERALRLDPASADTRINLGRAYAAATRWSEATTQFQSVLDTAPRHADAMYNLGVVAHEQRDLDRARSSFEGCLAVDTGHEAARERLAAVYLALGRYSQAAAQLHEVISREPQNVHALAALAETQFQIGAVDEALALANQARELDASLPGPHNLIAQIHHVRGELEAAAQALHRGYERTGADSLLGALVHVLHRQCDWPRWSSAWTQMALRLDQSSDLGSPFWLLPEPTTPEQQLSYTRRWAARTYPSTPVADARQPRALVTGERVRIGYYSGDFHQHPVSCLLVEALELHDRNRFEVFAYSYGPDDRSALRARLENAVEHFVDVAWDPDDVVFERIRGDDLHVLVDLKGYTAGDRLRVMARRPCATQIAWLGYPGTSGSDFIDYLIADPILVPSGADRHYAEKILRLPHSYQANDRKRALPQPRPRADYGLPEDAFVFCCFNQSVKITAEVFARWMNLLRTLPHSVLWLLEDNRWANENLRAAAEEAGIKSSRLIFAARVAPADHLARYRAADVALDTFPYTSHTTGSDALWLGCPLVALCGDTFAARVSASLLTNCGLPELVTYSLDEYEQLAYRLATDSPFLSAIRSRLATGRDAALLFDSARFTRELEALYVSLLK